MELLTCPACGEQGPPARVYAAQGLAKCGACQKLVNPGRTERPRMEPPPTRLPDGEASLGQTLVVGGFLLLLFLASTRLLFGLAGELLLKLELLAQGTPAPGRVEEVQVSKGDSDDPTYTHVLARVEAEPHGSFTCHTTLQGYYPFRVGERLRVLVHPTEPALSRVDAFTHHLFGPVLLLVFLGFVAWFLGAALWSLFLRDFLGGASREAVS